MSRAFLFLLLLWALPGGAMTLSEWRQLPAERRERILMNYERYRRLSRERRELLRERYRLFQGLDEGDRQRLMERWSRRKAEVTPQGRIRTGPAMRDLFSSREAREHRDRGRDHGPAESKGRGAQSRERHGRR